ncbi:MAG: Glyoxalase/bleomycin resistance protein/dioxygenase [Candidatus Nomurabacteria bacterium]|nr:Glyoxalase/bleomycin resistance protein/dioxygenase [Candidatus Nomurabacteria bacterium]
MKIHELGHVVLYVSNLKKSADFYKDILGFKEIHRDLHTALFSSGRTHHELLLIEVGGNPKEESRPTPGLYHIGFKIGNTPDELKSAYKELLEKGVTVVGATDHHVTHSLYMLDPDNNELELYVDVNNDWIEDPKTTMSPAKRLPYSLD